jgi:hypothetical protein
VVTLPPWAAVEVDILGMENTNNISNAEPNIPDKKKVAILNKQVSRLRAAIYIFTAVLILFACLASFWIYNYYTVSPFETYFSEAPQKPIAYLYLSPQKGNYKIGEEFSMDVLINTAGSNVVASAAYLSYDKNKMEALSVDITGSVFDMTAEKEIIADEGKIKITLGKPTPGIVTFKGNAVRMATIRFKAIQAVSPYVENISFDFTKGSSLYSTIILDDKKGTNILDATRGAKIFID